MALSLIQLRRAAADHLIKADESGFSIERRDAEAEAFDRLVRDALDSAGVEFVAFPRTDGRSGYSALYVIPFSEAAAD